VGAKSTSVKVSSWRPLRSCRRADAAAWVAVRRACESYVSLVHACQALGELVGAKIECWLVSASRGAAPRALDDGIAMELATIGGVATGITLEVEGALAVALTARAIKRPAPKLVGRVFGDDAAALAGGLAALVTTASRARAVRVPLMVRTAGTSSALLARLAKEPEVDVATFRVALDEDAYVARVLVRSGTAVDTRQRWDKGALARLGTLPLELPIVAEATLANAADLAGLEVGDAWMLGRATWARTPGTLRGEVVLAPPGAQIGACAALVEDGVVVLRAGQKELRQEDMPGEGENDPVVEAVGDVPIVVRVEVGAARMTAREWAGVGVGDVIGLAHKLAEPVTLRVGGAEVAKGELVDIEGEIGVRILSRHGRERAP
jgi:flagellar motor switch/type III secretory pathway protein FliN